MSVEEGVEFLQKNGPGIRSNCTPEAIPEILSICLSKGLLNLEEIAICNNNHVHMSAAMKWDYISETLQKKKEIRMEDIWEIFAGESSKHIHKYLRGGIALRNALREIQESSEELAPQNLFEMNKDLVMKYGESDVIRGRKIGQGSFGQVFEGRLKGQRIAIKVPKDKLRDDIMNELQFLAKLRHPNVVHFYGVLEEVNSGINLLFEYLDGDARTFVQSQDRSIETLLEISHDIALGMDYIHDLNIIHRDLAARNVLVDSKNVAKIADFGLSRLIDGNHDHYTIGEHTVRLWSWIPRECLETGGKFSKSSDIWSFGVTIWEIWNKGGNPYGDMNNEQIKQAISEGKNPMYYEMDKRIPKGIKKLLADIFVEERKRPSFANIKIFLDDMKKGNFNLDCSDQNDEIIHEFGGQSSSLNSERFYSAKSKFDQNSAKGSSENVSLQNVSGIEIVHSKYTLDENNVDSILKYANDNYTVKNLECVNISTRRVPQILNKFKLIETLRFLHRRSISGDCRYLESKSDGKKEVDCLFKMQDLVGYPNLKNLELRYIQVVFPPTFPDLSGLKDLFLDFCDISGDFIDFICRGNLEDLRLCGITPMLKKEDVEKLLMSKTLKYIGLEKHYREIFNSCFTPIGPDGRSMEKITPNTDIEFQRESFEQPWVQTIEFLDIVDASFNLTSYNVDLVLNSTNANSVVWLTYSNISTRRIPDISKKFKYIQRFEFWHHMNEDGKCLIFEPPKKQFLSYFWKPEDCLQSDACLLKMIDLKGFENLDHLCLENVDVEFPKSFSISQNLPKLRILDLIFCSVTGNFMDALTSPSNLEDVTLRGITPPLTKGDVEGLLGNKSLNYIQLSKHNQREIFTGSFTPIGPDLKPMREITLNSQIEFTRASFGPPWTQSAFPIEHGEFDLNNRNFESILNSPFENTRVSTLICTYIPTMRVPAILKKFKSIQKLKFEHIRGKTSTKCVYFQSMPNARREDICLFKMVDLSDVSNLKILRLNSMDVSFPHKYPDIPGLKELILSHCDITGDFIKDFICKSNLQVLILWGITPCLTKGDVEELLRNKTLKYIQLGKHIREIFSSSFTPIGPDGNQMGEIKQNADIIFIRDSYNEPWVQTVEEIKE